MSTDNPGDKPECWTFGKLGPAPNGDTLPEASSPPCMAVTKGLPQREHSMGPGKKPRARHKFFVSGSSVFWSRLSSSPHRRTPSLCQGQQREGERETGACPGWPWQPRFPLGGWVARGGLGGALRRQERTPEKGPASPGGPRQPGARPGGRGVLVHRQRAPGKAPACPGCPWPPRARLGSWVPLGGQGPPLRRQRPPGKAPACPGRPWPPRAHLGGSSSLEGWGPGAAAPAEGPCLRRRVTPATAGCVSPAAQAAGWPLAQAARGP